MDKLGETGCGWPAFDPIDVYPPDYVVLYFNQHTTYSQLKYPQLGAYGVHLPFTISYNPLRFIKR